MSGFEADNKPSGINKHLYSTNPDSIVGENIYSNDNTSINKEESYQTLDNKTVPVDTGDKVNPFNVRGVPGCKECGGSGWKDTKKHPHPCNECAKKTVPVIDTYLTKVGHTSQPPVVETRETVVTHSMPVEVPVTETTVRQVEVERTMPVTREVRTMEEVPVRTQVPVTRYEEVIQNVPVERVDYVTENVNVRTTVPVVEERTVNVPGTLNYGTTTDRTYDQNYFQTHDRTYDRNYEGNLDNKYTTTTTYDPNFDETTRNRILNTDSHIHDDKAKTASLLGPSTTLTGYAGVPGCKECGGEGWRFSKLTGRKKPCTHCLKITNNCPLCGNTGRRLDKDKKCKCQYAK